MLMKVQVMGLLCVMLFGALGSARGQIVIQYPGLPRYELGGQLGFLALGGPVGSAAIGPGVHFGYNYNQYFSLEAEVAAQNLSSPGSPTIFAFAGPRVGYTSGTGGVYFKLRPGVVHFPSHDSDLIPPLAQHRTHFAFDTGIVVTRYYERHFYTRFDAGYVAVNYGGGSYTDPFTKGVTHLGWGGGVSMSFGVGAHW